MSKENAKQLQFAETVATWIGAMAVIIGGLFGAAQYMEYRGEVQIERSMEFVTQFHGSEFLVASRLAVQEATDRRLSAINQILTDGDLDADQLAASYSREILRIVDEEKLSAQLVQLFVYFEQLLLCRELGLCDEEVAASFLDNEGRSLARTFYPEICRIRARWNSPSEYTRLINFYLGADEGICS